MSPSSDAQLTTAPSSKWRDRVSVFFNKPETSFTPRTPTNSSRLRLHRLEDQLDLTRQCLHLLLEPRHVGA